MKTRPLLISLAALLGLGLLILSQVPLTSEAQESRAPEARPDPQHPLGSNNQPAPRGPSGTKGASEPTPTSTPEVPTKPPAAPPKAAPEAKAAAPGPKTAPPALDPLRQGSVLRPTREVLIGLAGIYEEAGKTYAWFNAGSRTFSHAVEAQVGERVRAGGFVLEVLEIDLEERWVRYAWLSKDAQVAVVEQVAARGELRLPEMGVYRLASGETLTVGKVNALGQVTLRVFPQTYADDPMQGYDNHTEAQAGATFKGVRTLRLVETSISSESQAGWVKLKLR